MNSIFFALCIIAKFLSAGANESRGSGNIACLSNTQVIIKCAAPENKSYSIDWSRETRNTKSAQPLTNSTGSNKSTDCLMIKIKDEESLVINSVQLRDAGVYYCGTINSNTSQSVEFGSHLIVLESDPTCEVENVTVVENDYIRLHCSVTYNGLWTPVMEWTQLGLHGQEKINNDSILVNVTESRQYINQIVSLRILAKPYHDGIRFLCSTYFDFRDAERKHKISSNNAPEYNTTWKSPKIYVSYGPKDASIYPASEIAYPGDKLTCSAKGNPAPEYHWMDNETVYVGSQIEIVHSMIRDQPFVLRCRARNPVSASFTSITITVRSRFSSTNFAIAVIWLLCALLLIGIVFAVRQYAKDRNEQSYAVSYSREDHYEPNGHIVQDGFPANGIDVLNGNGYRDYADLRAAQSRNEARSISGARAAENDADHNEETIPKCIVSDGTEYAQMNIRPDNNAPTIGPVVHHSTIQVSNYASIDHTRKVPKRRK